MSKKKTEKHPFGPEEAQMPKISNGNGKSGICAVRIAQTGLIFCNPNGSEGQKDVFRVSLQQR